MNCYIDTNTFGADTDTWGVSKKEYDLEPIYSE